MSSKKTKKEWDREEKIEFKTSEQIPFQEKKYPASMQRFRNQVLPTDDEELNAIMEQGTITLPDGLTYDIIDVKPKVRRLVLRLKDSPGSLPIEREI